MNQLLIRAKKSFGEKEHNKNIVSVEYIDCFNFAEYTSINWIDEKDKEIKRELNEVAPRYKTIADIEAQQEILKSLDIIDDEAGSSKMLLK